MIYKFLNRDGESIIFKREDNKFLIEGVLYYRTLRNVDTNTIEYIDPSGGPFIGVGDDFSFLDMNLKDIFVESINIDGNKIVLNIK